MVDAALLGRTDELAALRSALLSPECRLLTLTGPPGVGKTWLATALAGEVGDRFPGGVVQVDLMSCGSAEAAAAVIDARLRTGRGTADSAVERLVGHLRDRTALLVLDSCEAVPELRSVLGAVLSGSRRTKVLATSQGRVRVASEREYAVPPLAMPIDPDAADGSVADLDALAEVPAMAVLLALTRSVRPDLSLGPDNARALVMVCRQLEGLPLALEVAAARLAQFEPAELAIRLRNRHRLLDTRLAAGGRHRSLRAAIGWSHDLLGPEERTVFRRVAVFPGAWSLGAAEQVVLEPGGPESDTLAAVGSLVAKSLVRRVVRVDGSEAFDLLDSLRSFGREQLARNGEEALVEGRFRRYYAALAQTAEAGMGTPDESFSVQWREDEVTNLRAALAGSIAADDLASALPLASAVGWHWYIRGALDESDVVTELVERLVREGVPRGLEHELGGTVLVAGILSWARGRRPEAAALLDRARRMADEQDVVRRSAIAHAFLGHLARTSGRVDVAWRQHSTAQAAFRGLGNRRGAAWASHDLALVALQRGQVDRAETLLQGAAPVFEEEGDTWALAWVWSGLAEVALRRERWVEAGSLLVRAVEVYLDNRDQPRIAHCRTLLAAVARGRGLTSTAEDLARPVGTGGADTLELARAVLEAAAAPESPLTPRQRQVAALVAQGATNRQIARQLGITDKTVEVHLAQIMARLDVHNRAQVATHAVRAGLQLSSG